MLRKESEAVPEGSGSVPQQEKFGSGQPALEDVYRMMKEVFKVWDTKMDKLLREYKEDWSSMDQRLTLLQHDARQPRRVMEADGPSKSKTRERTEGAATAVQAMHGESCSATRVDPGPKTNSTCFGVMAEPSDLPFRDNVLVENGAASPKSCLPSLEMCTTTAASGLLSTGKIFTATKTTFNEPPLRFYSTEVANSKETNLWISTPPAWYDESSFWRSKVLAAPSCRRVIETKSMQNRTFDPSGSQGRLRACPFLGSWRALLSGEIIRVGVAG